MGIIKSIINWYQKKTQRKNEKCNQLIFLIDCALKEINAIFDGAEGFIDSCKGVEWKQQNCELITSIKDMTCFRKAAHYKELLAKQAQLSNEIDRLEKRIQEHNEIVAQSKVQEGYSLIGQVEGRKLDQQQMTCIVKESHNQLVIAGAGTGKTTTVIGKIKYLLKKGEYSSEDILVLSFTNASAAELRERISAETNCDMMVATFHKLGLKIITQVEGVVPKITQLPMRRFIREQLLSNMQKPEYLAILGSYLLYDRIVYKSEFEFTSQTEYEEYLKWNPPVTIRNERVKSYGELDIANFLAENGIEYIYEQAYEIDTRTDKHRQYHPDFYLPQYNVYIEYFGVDRNGDVPPYFEGKDGLSASKVYQDSMNWKRGIHSKHKTVLIECYAYEKFEGVLLEQLKKKLEKESIPLQVNSPEELWAVISNEEDIIEDLAELFEALINLIKSNGYDIKTVREMNRMENNSSVNASLLLLLEPIFNAYCRWLLENKEIDFNDMIHKAAEYVRQGRYINPYKYVIVDEYQDISKARFCLLECLRKSRDFSLFCVGDDWQSIYRFAGSDIGYILNFSRYWGGSDISKIETTYRFSQKLIEISGDFIMENPTQIQKAIIGKQESVGLPFEIISAYNDKFVVEFMTRKLKMLPKNSSVYFIGRYSFDVKMLKDDGRYECRYHNQQGGIDVMLKTRPDLDMTFLTAHKSKGLQADYVFIINNKNSRLGFPSKMQEVPLIELLLEYNDGYPHAEERRLFYVALTRAKKKVFLLAIKGQESEFVLELTGRHQKDLQKDFFTCPRCGGRLIKKTGQYSSFLGCVNYRKTGCTYTRKLK